MLFHFQLDFSDVDRGVYEKLDFRLMQHPSETPAYLLTRALAYALSYQAELQFSPVGLGDPEAPALLAQDLRGNTLLWIEVGNPSARKLHKATKIAKSVQVYTSKNAELLAREIAQEEVHRRETIEIRALDPKFLQLLAQELKKNCRWSVLQQQGQIDILANEKSFTSEIRVIPILE